MKGLHWTVEIVILRNETGEYCPKIRMLSHIGSISVNLVEIGPRHSEVAQYLESNDNFASFPLILAELDRKGIDPEAIFLQRNGSHERDILKPFHNEHIMSATTPPAKREHKHTGIRHHATQPHGLILIGAVIFVAAWAFWTFFLASPATVPVP